MEKGNVYALRTFKRKSDQEQFYIAEVVLDTVQETPNYIGQNQTSVFLSEDQYTKLRHKFVKNMPVELNVSIMGNRVQYSLAS